LTATYNAIKTTRTTKQQRQHTHTHRIHRVFTAKWLQQRGTILRYTYIGYPVRISLSLAPCVAFADTPLEVFFFMYSC